MYSVIITATKRKEKRVIIMTTKRKVKDKYATWDKNNSYTEQPLQNQTKRNLKSLKWMPFKVGYVLMNLLLFWKLRKRTKEKPIKISENSGLKILIWKEKSMGLVVKNKAFLIILYNFFLCWKVYCPRFKGWNKWDFIKLYHQSPNFFNSS